MLTPVVSLFTKQLWITTGIILLLVACLIVMTKNGQRTKPGLIWLVLVGQLLVTGVNIYYFISQLQHSVFQRPLLSLHSTYFVGQVWSLFQTLLAGWISAAILGWFAYIIFIRIGREQMFDRQDVWLAVIGAAIVGWPGILIFLAITFVLAVVAMLGLVIFRKKKVSDRLVITPYIFPAVIVTLLAGPYLLALTHLDKIRF